eukprot:6488980-Amphidinium_carterae.2
MLVGHTHASRHCSALCWLRQLRSACMATREVNHALYLRLACYGTRQWLLHTGTGERISLPPGEWSLHIGEGEHEGVGALSCVKPGSDDELYWANTLLSLSLHVLERDGVEVSRIIQQT